MDVFLKTNTQNNKHANTHSPTTTKPPEFPPAVPPCSLDALPWFSKENYVLN